MRTLTFAICTICFVSEAHAQQFCSSLVPQSDSFWTIPASGELHDSSTQFIWARCLAGQTWNGNSCDGAPATQSWQAALRNAPPGWRLPNIKELESLVARECASPALNTVAFAGQPVHTAWSSTPNWSLDFDEGIAVRQASSATLLNVRYVKNGASAIAAYTPSAGNDSVCNANIPASRPNVAWTSNANGTVTDMDTGLTWSRCVVGQSYVNGRCTGTPAVYSWQDALQYADTLRPQGWRLPNVKELESLTEARCASPSINGDVFPDQPETNLWSSTPTWAINFADGMAIRTGANAEHPIRLVKDGAAKAAFTRLPDHFPICVPNVPTDFVLRDWQPDGDGIIRDSSVGLRWQRCYVGQTWDRVANTCRGTPTLMNWTTALNVAFDSTFGNVGRSGWRLPNIKELQSLVDSRCQDAAISADVFPNSPGWIASTTTPTQFDPLTAWSATPNWFMNVNDGIVEKSLSSSSLRAIRLVTGGYDNIDAENQLRLGLGVTRQFENTARLQITESDEKLVLIFHGWNSSSAVWSDALAGAICRKLGATTIFDPLDQQDEKIGVSTACKTGNGWRVAAFNWAPISDVAWSESIVPWQAYNAAVGLVPGIRSAILGGGYAPAFVHLIGHSAGSAIVHELSGALKTHDPSITLHNTYFDAFCPSPPSPCQYGGYAIGESDYAEHYVDSRPLFIVEPGFTNRQLKHAHNFDVAWLDGLGLTRDFVRNHAWPYLCYLRSMSEYDEACLDRSNAPVPGFALSAEHSNLASLAEIRQKMQDNKVVFPPGWLTRKRVSPSIDDKQSTVHEDSVIPPPGGQQLAARTGAASTVLSVAAIPSNLVVSAVYSVSSSIRSEVPAVNGTCVNPISGIPVGNSLSTTPLVAISCPNDVPPQNKTNLPLSASADAAVAGWTSARVSINDPFNAMSFDYSLEGVVGTRGTLFVDDVAVFTVTKDAIASGLQNVPKLVIPDILAGEHRIGVRSESVGEGKFIVQNIRLIPQVRVNCILDLDANERLEPLVDGLLLIRGLLEAPDSSFVTSTGLALTTAQQSELRTRIGNLKLSGLIDVDKNTSTNADSDGLMILRAMLGYKGDGITDGLIGANAQRNAQEIRTYMKEACGLTVD
jgi:hypothetical protein